ncbi:hypothetical protein HS7_04560 [Sulfolobales archaeon HS-7]|nr:hypothetical protein HS7_04560 [Sulfolobales archaeon HS-7]
MQSLDIVNVIKTFIFIEGSNGEEEPWGWRWIAPSV